MTNILISGSTGFIGGHLMKYLGELNYEVDTISTKEFMKEDWSRLDNYQLLRPVEIYDKSTNTVAVPKRKPDIVVHCAWLREKDLHAPKHLEFAELSCNFLQQCKDRGIPVINLGSSSEYGVKDEPMKEDMICEPINTYGVAKLMVTLYAKKLGFNTLRLFTVTGEGGHSFKNIYESAVRGDTDMKGFAASTNTRDYIPINTVCVAIERLIHSSHIYGEVINVGSGYQQSNMRVVDNIDHGLAEVIWGTYKQSQYEPRHWSANTDKMKQLLNV